MINLLKCVQCASERCVCLYFLFFLSISCDLSFHRIVTNLLRLSICTISAKWSATWHTRYACAAYGIFIAPEIVDEIIKQNILKWNTDDGRMDELQLRSHVRRFLALFCNLLHISAIRSFVQSTIIMWREQLFLVEKQLNLISVLFAINRHNFCAEFNAIQTNKWTSKWPISSFRLACAICFVLLLFSWKWEKKKIKQIFNRLRSFFFSVQIVCLPEKGV